MTCGNLSVRKRSVSNNTQLSDQLHVADAALALRFHAINICWPKASDAIAQRPSVRPIKVLLCLLFSSFIKPFYTLGALTLGRNVCFKTFPEALRGNSVKNSISYGTLYFAS